MDAVTMLKERRSVRKYKDEKVSHEVIKEIMESTRYAQSWANFQIARYTFVEDEDKINQLATKGVEGFVYNIGILKKAKSVVVLSCVKGKSGKIGEEYVTSKENVWEIFDAGIACQTFCLAAFEKGVGTCVMGVINDKEISQIVDLPEGETVAALIVYGYPDEQPKPTARKEVDEIIRFI